MKNVLRFTGALVVVALVSFVVGWYLEHSKASAADAARLRCQTSLDSAAQSSSREQGIIGLYRARVEVLRANFGNATESLDKARGGFPPADPASAALARAAAAVKAQDPAAGDRIQEAITAAETHAR